MNKYRYCLWIIYPDGDARITESNSRKRLERLAAKAAEDPATDFVYIEDGDEGGFQIYKQ